MGGSDEIDIGAGDILQLEHRLGQLFDCYLAAVAMMADVEVLAEDTAEIAAGKENSARAATAYEDAFFAEVGANGANEGHIADAAKTSLAFTAKDFAHARAERAGIEKIPELANGITKAVGAGR